MSKELELVTPFEQVVTSINGDYEKLPDLYSWTRKAPLPLLIQRWKEILQIIDDLGGEVPADIEVIFDSLKSMLAGKVDNICVKQKVIIPMHIAACKEQENALKEQRKFLEVVGERIDDFMRMCFGAMGVKRMDGVAWRARIQKNPASIVIDDEDAIPEFLKECRVNINVKFDGADADQVTYWIKFIEVMKKNENIEFDGDVEFVVKKKDLKELLKGKTPITGARLVDDKFSVRYEKSKAAVDAKTKARPLNEADMKLLTYYAPESETTPEQA